MLTVYKEHTVTVKQWKDIKPPLDIYKTGNIYTAVYCFDSVSVGKEQMTL